MENEFKYRNRTFKHVGFMADLLIYACGDSRILIDKQRNVVYEYIIKKWPEQLNRGKNK